MRDLLASTPLARSLTPPPPPLENPYSYLIIIETLRTGRPNALERNTKLIIEFQIRPREAGKFSSLAGSSCWRVQLAASVQPNGWSPFGGRAGGMFYSI